MTLVRPDTGSPMTLRFGAPLSAGRHCVRLLCRPPSSCRGRPGSTIVCKAATRDPTQRIVITGMGVASCFGNDVDTFYDSLLAGKSGVGMIDRFDASEFPTKFAAQIRNFSADGSNMRQKLLLMPRSLIDKKSERRYDDCLKYTMVGSKKALKAAGLDPQDNADEFEKLDLQRVGVLVGTGMGGLQVFQDGVQNLVERGYKKISPFFIPYAITNMGGALVGMEFGFMGPNYSISTACATANYCFVAAANHIRNGEADMILAGGSEAPIIPVGLGGFVACRALSSRNAEPESASRPWDKNRDGFVMGEGAGVLCMESLEHAQKRGAPIIAEYLGGATNCDAYHMTDPRADGLGVSTCIELALKNSQIQKEQVNYINAHATSTLVGDVAELKAVKKVFTDTRHLKMNATKSMIGHCLGAAGGMEAVATIKAITTGWLHPTINHVDPIEETEGIDCVPNEKKQLAVTAGLSSSFGFGGHNSVVCFAPFEE